MLLSEGTSQAKKPRTPPALPDEREAAGIAVVGLEMPVVEAELTAEGLEAERILGGLPAVSRAVQTGRVVVTRQGGRIGHERGCRVQRAREHEALGERADHLAVGRDGESLQGVGEVDEYNGSFLHLLHEPLVAALFRDADLTSQLALPVVVELPVGVLRLVRALHRREEDVLERAPVVDDRDLRQDNGQINPLEQVRHLLVLPDPRDERHGLALELLGRNEVQLEPDELLETIENRDVVHFRLYQPEVAVRIHVLTLDGREWDAPAVAVHELEDRVDEFDAEFAAQDGREAVLTGLLTAGREPELAQKRFFLPALELSPNPFKRHHGGLHGLISVRAYYRPKSVLPLPGAKVSTSE